jgi:hypothetical protein
MNRDLCSDRAFLCLNDTADSAWSKQLELEVAAFFSDVYVTRQKARSTSDECICSGRERAE